MARIWNVPLVGRTNADLRESYKLTANGEPVALTGKIFRMGIADKTNTVRKELTNDAGFQIVDAAAGVVEIVITAAEMAELGAGEFRHDCLLIDDAGTRPLWIGKLSITRGVTPHE